MEEMPGLNLGVGEGGGVRRGSKELSDGEMLELNNVELKFGRPH